MENKAVVLRMERFHKIHSKHRCLRWIISTFLALAALWLFLFFCISVVKINDEVMVPGLKQGDTVIIDKLGKHFSLIGRSDIIAFYDGEHNLRIGRVVALGGESICCIQGELYINETFLIKEQSYTLSKCSDFDTVFVDKGSVFVLCDNREYIDDSRQLGPVPLTAVIGRVKVRLLPQFNIFF